MFNNSVQNQLLLYSKDFHACAMTPRKGQSLKWTFTH